MALTNNEIKDLINLQRNVEFSYQLDTFTNGELIKLRNAVDKSISKIMSKLKSKDPSTWSYSRTKSLLNEVKNLSIGMQKYSISGIGDIAQTAYGLSIDSQNDIFSFGGRMSGFNSVALSAAQIKSLVYETPVGGRLLNKWITDTFETEIIANIESEILAGMLSGESYPALVKRLGAAFETLNNQQLVTLARTYVQSANVNSMFMIYESNMEAINGFKWSSTLETGYFTTGHGTCPRCAALDGEVWKTLDEMPQFPLHPNCRCFPRCITKDYKELGLDMDEIKDAYRPYTMRPDFPVGAGGKRSILEHGFHDGDYGTWFAKQGKTFQQNVVGKTRQSLISSGKIKFSDIVDKNTGRLLRLDELPGGKKALSKILSK